MHRCNAGFQPATGAPAKPAVQRAPPVDELETLNLKLETARPSPCPRNLVAARPRCASVVNRTLSSGTETIPLSSYPGEVARPALGARLVSTLRYVFSTEVHAYAFAIAANVLLSVIPFAVLMLTFCPATRSLLPATSFTSPAHTGRRRFRWRCCCLLPPE